MKVFSKRFVNSLFLCAAIFLMVLALGCGGGGGSNCKNICDKLVTQCQIDDGTLEECEDGCTENKDVFRATVFNDASKCILDTACEQLDPFICIQTAAAKVDSSVLDPFFSAVCDKIVQCADGALEKPDCVTMVKSNLSENEEASLWLKVIKDSSLTCISDCFGKAECADAMGDAGEVIKTCTETCGLNFV